MRNKIAGLAVAAWCAGVSAAPVVNNVDIVTKAGSDTITIRYTLENDPAVVTMDLRVNGVSVGENALTNLTGDVNELVGTGSHTIGWRLPAGWSASPRDVSAVVTAWATNCPPDYMVVCLTNFQQKVRYYTSTNSFPAPLEDVRWRTKYLVMRKIPAAGVEWMMGSRKYETSRNTDSEYRRPVVLTEDYYMGIYEMTREQWRLIDNQSNLPAIGNFVPAELAAETDIPVGHISYTNIRGSFDVAEQYRWPASGYDNLPNCRVKSWRTRLGGIRVDLPTEAQWEYACRAGTTAQNYLDVDLKESAARLGEIAWYAENATNATYGCVVPHRVGLLKPNAWGLYDMLGNVNEWCLDWTPYHTADNGTLEVDPVGPASAQINVHPGENSEFRSLRGGCFAYKRDYIRAGWTNGWGLGWNNNRTNECGSDPGMADLAKYSGGLRLCAPAQAVR